MKVAQLVLVALAATAAATSVAGAASALAIVGEFAEPNAHGRMSRTVDGVQFSIKVPRSSGWEARSLYVSKSTGGPQVAEAVIFWTGLRAGGEAAPCAKLLGLAIGGSIADLAAVVARAPGTMLGSGPTRVTVGGRLAQHVELTVRKDLGCDPGYFFTWRPQTWGAFWNRTDVGALISVWIVDVDGTPLWIEAETAKGGHHLNQEITKIVGSIRFK